MDVSMTKSRVRQTNMRNCTCVKIIKSCLICLLFLFRHISAYLLVASMIYFTMLLLHALLTLWFLRDNDFTLLL